MAPVCGVLDEFPSPLAEFELEVDVAAEETEIGRRLPAPQPKCDDSKTKRTAENKTRRLMDEISESGRQKPIRGSEWLATGNTKSRCSQPNRGEGIPFID